MAITEVLPQRHDLIWNREGRSALTVLIFLVPGHLDGFELRFVRRGGITRETNELRDPFVHVREAHGQRIGVRILVCQRNRNVFKIVPSKIGGHQNASCKRSSSSEANPIGTTRKAQKKHHPLRLSTLGRGWPVPCHAPFSLDA